MHDSNQQEFFSRSYAWALVSAAGYNIFLPVIDRRKIDFVIQGDQELCKINVQLKSTTVAAFRNGELKFRLDRDTYDALRQPSTTLFLLVVVVMPRDASRWASLTPTSLILRRCAYWLNLEGSPPISTDTVTVSIARGQRFTVDFLQETMRSLLTEGSAA